MSARKFSVCVFCGSREGTDPAFRKAATELGAGIAQRHWRLVYGGGEIGIMGTLAAAAHEGGAEVLGIMPRRLIGREAGSRRLAELVRPNDVRTQTAHVRGKRRLHRPTGRLRHARRAPRGRDAEAARLVAAPPLLIIDVAGVWATLFAAFAAVVKHGFADKAALGLYEVTDGVGAALTTLERAAS